MDAEEGLELLPRGEVDVVVAEEYDYAPRLRDPSLSIRDVCRDPLLLILPADHPLAATHARQVRLASLADDAVGRGARRHRVPRRARPRLPRARRLRAGHPPPLQRHRRARAARRHGRGGRVHAVARAPRPGARRDRPARSRRGRWTGASSSPRGAAAPAAPALKAVARALRDQARALGLPAAAPA